MKTLNNALRRLALWLAVVVALGSFTRTPAYVLITDTSSGIYIVTWDPGSVPIRVMLNSTTTLSDGLTQSSSVIAAINAWNPLISTTQLSPQALAIAPYSNGNDLNEIVMDSTVDGDAFDENTLAVTVSYRAGNSRVESDIVFNSKWTWDSYRGNLRQNEDIQRVAIHEVGHLLGLTHPDQATPPQSVNAVMNSRASNVDTMQADDIAGARSMYGTPGSPPVNDSFANATTINLSNGSAQFTGSNAGATAESSEPALDNSDPGRRTIWWKWTPPTGGVVNVTTLGSNFDTLLGAYTGSAVNALTQIVLNDDVESGVVRTSNIAFPATAGTTYYLAVDGWAGYMGSVTLNLNFTAAPTDVAPAITSHPTSRTLNIGATTVFTFAANGTPAPTYQWQRLPAGSGTWENVSNGSIYSGATSTSLTLTATYAMNGDQFRGVATNSAGSATSIAATLFVNPPTAPSFTIQPSPMTVETGSVAQFTASATGNPAPTLQWQYQETPTSTWLNLFNSSSVSGANSTTLSFSTTYGQNGYRYRCAAINSAATIYSSEVSLTVQPRLPTITTQPGGLALLAGASFQLSVGASSEAPLTYQWRLNGNPIADATSSTYTGANLQPASEGNYTVVVTNSRGSVTSDPAAVVIATLPVITAQPQPRDVYATTTVVFSVTATSNAPLSYQWQRDGEPIEGANSATYSIENVQVAQAGSYRVLVSTIAGVVTSQSVALLVTPATTVAITQQPESRNVMIGQPVGFTVVATGLPAPTYQWQVERVASPNSWTNLTDNATVSGATTANLSLATTTVGENGDRYRCVVSNLVSVMNSAAARLSVSPAGLVKLAAGRHHSVRLDFYSAVSTSGLGSSGQLGNGTTGSISTPQSIQIPGQMVADVSAFAFHTLFLTSAKELWATGNNATGQLGDGTSVNKLVPVKITTDVVAVAAGFFHSAFVKSDGTLWTVGGNDSGQLGDGTTSNRSTPAQIATGVVDVAAGIRQTLFLKSDGTLWGVGNLDGSDNFVSNPIQLATDVKAMAAGGYHTIFLKTNGSVWTLGYNSSGQLGDGTTVSRTTPMQIAAYARAVAAGYFHSAMIDGADGVGLFGSNGLGQLGNGGSTNAATVQYPSLDSDVASIAAGEGFTLFTLFDGSLWATGVNSDGQYGSGNTTGSLVPTRVRAGVMLRPTVPGAVTAVDAGSPAGVRLGWEPLGNADSYEVWRSTTNDSATATRVAADLRWALYFDASPGAGSAFYWVKSVNGAGASEFSAVATAGQIVAKPPTITTPPAAATVSVGDAVNFSVVATGDAPLTYQWRRNGDPLPNATAATYSISSASTTDAGSYTVVVTNSAGSVISDPAVLTVNKLAQTITFVAPADRAFTTTPFALTASASSSLAVTFTVESGPATLNGDTLTLTGVGPITVRAAQAGNTTYAAAPSVDRTFTVTKAAATVTLGALSATYDGTAKNVTATTTPAGLNVVTTYDGGAAAPTNAGSYAVVATVAEANYSGSASDTLVIAKAVQTITFTGPVDQPYTTTPITLSATATSGLTVTFAVANGPATVAGNALTLTGTGTVTLTASQSGDQNRAAAPDVSRSFVVSGNYQSWLLAHFTGTELLDAQISGPNADPDGDGLANLLEYALDLEPRTATTSALPEVATSASEWTYTYTRSAERSDLTYAVEISTDLSTWTTTNVTHELVATDAATGAQTWRARVPLTTGANVFFRLKVATANDQ